MKTGGAIASAAILVAAVLADGGRAVAAPRCTAVARVSGAPVLVAPVLAMLRERGVPVAGSSRCGSISAVLASEEERVRVTIIDGDGRVVERLVDDVEGAATAVESWARGDLLDPLLAAREAPPPPVVDRESPRPIELDDGRPGRRKVDVAALVEAAMSDDGALWAGVRGQGCVELGVLCVGGIARYAVDTEVDGLASDNQSHRSAIDLLLSVEVPIAFGRGERFALSPGAAVGLGAIRSSREEVCDECADEATALLLRGHAAASARLGGSWHARLDLSLGWAPWGQRLIGEIDRDINDEPPLAGSPTWLSALGLGLVYGGL